MKIEIFFLKKSDWLSDLIKRITHTPHSHCGMLLGGFTVFDTDFTRDLTLRQLPWKDSDIDVITLDLSDIQYEETIKWIRKNNLKKYDNVENLRFIRGYKKSNGDAKLNCVEATLSYLCDIGILNPIYKEDNLSPGELYDILNRRVNS